VSGSTGGGALERRSLQISFGRSFGEVDVALGHTRVMCRVEGEIVRPFVDRPREGILSFNVDFSPMASPQFEVGRPNENAISISSLLESLLKKSQAVDVESLCLIAGQKVWSIRVDVRALNDAGNLKDACALAALASLIHYRKQSVTVSSGVAKVQQGEVIPLSLHHRPVLITLSYFFKGTVCLLDPSLEEEELSGGTASVAINQHSQLCAFEKKGGVPLPINSVHDAIEVATRVAKEILEDLDRALKADAEWRAKKGDS